MDEPYSTEPAFEDPETARLRAELEAQTARETAAVAEYKRLLLNTEPTLDPALITGDSFEAVRLSFEAARQALNHIRHELRAEMAAKVAPQLPIGRSTPGAPRTPLEKIKDGLSRGG